MASTPVAAVIAGGTVQVSSGSSTAMSARISGLSTAILALLAELVISARIPASDPVPAVVGTWARRESFRATLSGPTTSGRVCAPSHSTATSFATSITDPPPSPITRSGHRSRATASAASSAMSSGSGGTSVKTRTVPVSFSRSTSPATGGAVMTERPSGALGPGTDAGDGSGADLEPRGLVQGDEAIRGHGGNPSMLALLAQAESRSISAQTRSRSSSDSGTSGGRTFSQSASPRALATIALTVGSWT